MHRACARYGWATLSFEEGQHVVTVHSGGTLTVTARWNDNGLLELHGHDLKPGMFGDEYEYWLVVPEDQLALVASDIGADLADRDAILERLAAARRSNHEPWANAGGWRVWASPPSSAAGSELAAIMAAGRESPTTWQRSSPWSPCRRGGRRRLTTTRGSNETRHFARSGQRVRRAIPGQGRAPGRSPRSRTRPPIALGRREPKAGRFDLPNHGLVRPFVVGVLCLHAIRVPAGDDPSLGRRLTERRRP